MTHHRFIKWAAPLALVALALTACGGGSDGNAYNESTGNEPTAVGQIYDAFIAHVQQLIGTAPETTEPENVAAFDPAPTADNTEPVKTE